MPTLIRRLIDSGSGPLRGRILTVYAGLIAANLAAWAWALIAFRHTPLLLGSALLAYGFGLRHAVDADHIAAIDNVTRKLMQDGRRPVAVGLFFSLGHSSVVVAASAVIAATASALGGRLAMLQPIGTLISAAFLLTIAAINIVILAAVVKTLRRVKAGAAPGGDDLDLLLAGRGLLARLLRPLFGLIRQSWHMYPLGLLFGLGFDTATEIGLLGLSATQAAHGLPIWSILVFPALFTAAMCLVDTTDGILMLGAYGWALIRPLRKLYYNITITLVSVIVALAVGGTEALGLAGQHFALPGSFWTSIVALNDHFGTIGTLIVAIFAFSWAASYLVYRARAHRP